MMKIEDLVSKYTARELASKIDHTLVKPSATEDELKRVCLEAIEYGFVGCCVNPWYVDKAAEMLSGTGVKLVTVAGFPLGTQPVEIKLRELEVATSKGAEEVDVVMNIGAFKSGHMDYVKEELTSLVDKARETGIILKVIIETSLLTDEEIEVASKLVKTVGAHFIKTNTGFGPRGVTLRDVYLIKKAIGDIPGLKVAGGIRHYIEAAVYLEMGAERIGTSTGVQIIKEYSVIRSLEEKGK